MEWNGAQLFPRQFLSVCFIDGATDLHELEESKSRRTVVREKRTDNWVDLYHK